MEISSTPVPSRKLALDGVVETLASGPAASAVVLVTGLPGSGATTFTRELGKLCGAGRRIDATQCLRITGLPWETSADGSGLGALITDPPGDVRRGTRLLVDAIGSGDRRFDAAVLVTNAHLVDQLTIETLLSAAGSARARLVVVFDWTRAADPAAPLSVLGDPDPEHDVLYDAVRVSADHVVDLPRLTVDDVAVLAEQAGALVPATQLAHLVRHTDGIARSVTELLREVAPTDWLAARLVLPAPSSVRRAVRARLAGLSDDAVALVDAVAVLEEGDQASGMVDVREVSQVSGVAATRQARGALLTSGLVCQLDSDATVLRIRDTVTRRALLDEIGPARRAELHARAADVVADPARRLRHRWFTTDLPDDDLAVSLVARADQDAAAGAWASVGELLELAARASSQADAAGARLLGATDALVGAGDVPGASRHLAELESLRETPQRNAVLGYLAVVRGRSAEANSRLHRAWELVNPRRDPAEAAVVAQRHVLHSLAKCDAAELVSWADRAMTLGAPDSPAAIEAAAIRGLGSAVVGSSADALAAYDRWLGEVPDGAVAARVRMAAGWLLLAADDPLRARDELERAVPTDHRGGSLRISLWARAWLARVQFLTGDWTAALHTATTGAALAEASGMALLEPLLQWTRSQVYTLRGDWDMAQQCLRDGSAGRHDYPIMQVPAALGQAALHEARAEYPAVVRTLAFLAEPWAREWISAPGFWPWQDVYANALVVTGRLDEADAFLREHEARAEEAGRSSAVARLAFARGRWHGQHGDLDAARERFTTSIDLLGRLPYPYDLARAHYAYGQTLRRAGRRAEADTMLTTAREHFARLGAATYVNRCDRELAAGGLHLPRSGDAYSDVLTPQESTVAELVAQGRTNKDVAAELFLSVKTVQYHLTRIYAKLGVSSRTQLAAQWPGDDHTVDEATSPG